MKKLYYNPEEVPVGVKYIMKSGEIKELNCTDDYMELDYIDNLFKKRDYYQDIVVKLASKNEAYYPIRKKGYGRMCVYEAVPVIGKISLRDFSDGGGYLRDKHIYEHYLE